MSELLKKLKRRSKCRRRMIARLVNPTRSYGFRFFLYPPPCYYSYFAVGLLGRSTVTAGVELSGEKTSAQMQKARSAEPFETRQSGRARALVTVRRAQRLFPTFRRHRPTSTEFHQGGHALRQVSRTSQTKRIGPPKGSRTWKISSHLLFIILYIFIIITGPVSTVSVHRTSVTF